MSNILRNRVKSRSVSRPKYSYNLIRDKILKQHIYQIENPASKSSKQDKIAVNFTKIL